MNYFKVLGSAASSVLSKGAGVGNLPYSVGDKNIWFEGRTIWSLHEGTKRDDDTPVSVFVFDASQPAHNPRRSLLPLARNASRKLRTTRHPDVLRVLDSTETDSCVYIVTEKVTPLGKHLDADQSNRSPDYLVWGLYSVTTALKFLNADCASTHGNIRTDSIFVSATGEWRLGGFDVLSNQKDESAVLFNYGGLVPDASQYAAPEVSNGGWATLRDYDPHVLDSYSFALLICELFNGQQAPVRSASMPARGSVPLPIFNHIRRMLNANPKSRMSSGQLLEAGNAETGFFKQNKLVKVSEGLGNFVLASEGERAAVLRILESSSDSFPSEFLSHKVLPLLVKAFELPSAAASGPASPPNVQLLPLILNLGAKLPDKGYAATVGESIVKAYKSTDRAVRMVLLENLDKYADRLDNKVLVEKIWPNLITGFNDSVAIIREATVKSILLIAPKLSDRILNNDLLRHLAKMQTDVEAGIRTNTTILLGRLSKHLTLNTRRKVLVPAFGRSLRDPFVHARVAGLMAFMATVESFDKEDLAVRIVPQVAPCLVDPEKIVRDQAVKAVDIFLKKIAEFVVSMPDTMLPPEGSEQAKEVGQPSLVSSAGGAASALAGWAVSSAMTSLSKKMAATELQNSSMDAKSNTSPTPVVLKPRETPRPLTPGSMSGTASPSLQTAFGAGANGSGSLTVSSSGPASTSSWASGDLMDVNDDADDWSAFETPVPAALSSPLPAKGLRRGVPGPRPGAQPRVTSSSAIRKGGSLKLGKKDAATAARSAALAVMDEEFGGGNEWDMEDTSAMWGAASSSRPSSVKSPPPLKGRSSPASSKSPSVASPPASNMASPLPPDSSNAWDSGFDEDDKPSSRATSPGAGGAGSDKAAAGGVMTKEEKAAEMAKRREERRLRLEKLKEEKAARLGAKKL